MRGWIRILLHGVVLAVVCAPVFAQSSQPMYLFIPNGTNGGNGEGIFSAFQLSPTTGALSVVPGSPFQAGSDAKALAVDPTGRFVYVMDDVTKSIWGYSIDPASGVPTLLPGAPFATGLESTASIVVDPTARFMFVGGYYFNEVENVSFSGFAVFALDPTTGIPTPIMGSPIITEPVGGQPGDVGDLLVDVSGTFLYADVTSYSINFETGVPALIGVENDVGNGSLALDPLGQYAVLGTTFNLVDPIYGYISPIPDTGVTGAGGEAAFDPTGRFLYTGSCGNPCTGGTETTYQVNQSVPSLTQISTSPITASSTSVPLVDPTGHFMYFLEESGSAPYVELIYGYSVNPTTGTLTAIAGLPSTISYGTGGVLPAAIAPSQTGITNPAPSVSSLSPASGTTTGANFTLTVNGSSFVPGARVYFGGRGRVTTFVSATQLTANILAADIATGGTAVVFVYNPPVGGERQHPLSSRYLIRPR